jgi:hypothetical protein
MISTRPGRAADRFALALAQRPRDGGATISGQVVYVTAVQLTMPEWLVESLNPHRHSGQAEASLDLPGFPRYDSCAVVNDTMAARRKPDRRKWP